MHPWLIRDAAQSNKDIYTLYRSCGKDTELKKTHTQITDNTVSRAEGHDSNAKRKSIAKIRLWKHNALIFTRDGAALKKP